MEIRQPSRGKRTDYTAEQQRAEGPAEAQIAESEMLDEERTGPRNDCDVKPKEQSTQRSRRREKKDVRKIDG